MDNAQKLRATILLGVLAILIAMSSVKGEADVSRNEKLEMLHSVAIIHNGERGYGSAVVVFSDEDSGYSLLLTANHVLVDAEAGDLSVVLFPDASEHGASVVKRSAKYDLAILRIDTYHPYVAERASELKPILFDRVWRVGGAVSGVPHPNQGIIIMSGNIFFSMSNDMFFGDSGGGVFQEHNGQLQLIGIMIAVPMWQDHYPVSHMGLCYNMKIIKEFLEN